MLYDAMWVQHEAAIPISLPEDTPLNSYSNYWCEYKLWMNWLQADLVVSPISCQLSSIDNGWPLCLWMELLNPSGMDNLRFESSIFINQV